MKKKVTKLFFITTTMILLLSLTIPIAGTMPENKNVEIFVDSQSLSAKKVEMIKKQLFYDEKNIHSTSSILCIFGHDLETGTVYKYTHSYYTTIPHCKLEQYKYEVCRRDTCDYSKYTLLNTQRVSCH